MISSSIASTKVTVRSGILEIDEETPDARCPNSLLACCEIHDTSIPTKVKPTEVPKKLFIKCQIGTYIKANNPPAKHLAQLI